MNPGASASNAPIWKRTRPRPRIIGESSLVDYNRSGVPLLEIVTKPDIHSAEEARQYLIKLRNILRYLGVSTADMEKGAMRCEANVSVSPAAATSWASRPRSRTSTRSVRSNWPSTMKSSARSALLESGGEVKQVTMGWNENQNRTIFQRSKEGAEDYRYFPEPDLPPLALSEQVVSSIRASLPELPDAKKARFVAEYVIKAQDAQVLVDDADVADYFEASVSPPRCTGPNHKSSATG